MPVCHITFSCNTYLTLFCHDKPLNMITYCLIASFKLLAKKNCTIKNTHVWSELGAYKIDKDRTKHQYFPFIHWCTRSLQSGFKKTSLSSFSPNIGGPTKISLLQVFMEPVKHVSKSFFSTFDCKWVRGIISGSKSMGNSWEDLDKVLNLQDGKFRNVTY